jgi:hypothetical protein
VNQVAPTVSVLMPTYRQAAFVARSLGSLLTQTFGDFECIVVDDGSDDGTGDLIRTYDDPRIRYVRFRENRGLGVALNTATGMARGALLSYLPTDDRYDSDHLATCVSTLTERPEVYLAYSGVRWVSRTRGISIQPPTSSPTLRPDIPPGSEKRVLAKPDPRILPRLDVRSGNFLALVQVVHRRGLEDRVRWRERATIVSDSLEVDFWRELIQQGARFHHTGATTCEWGDHPQQRHKIIAGRGQVSGDQLGHGFGLSRYRQFYGIRPGVQLNWQPATEGMAVDEHVRYGPLTRGTARRATPSDGLNILLVGALSFNPERILALERDGHRLTGLWMTEPHFWENTGPLPFGNIGHIPHTRDWHRRVRELRPDVVYALLNWQAIPIMHEVLTAGLDAPFVLHLKESPMTAMQVGTWPMLRELILGSDARLFISEQARSWSELTLGRSFRDEHTLIMDGDLPLADWAVDDWADSIGEPDEPHTVCVGRMFLEPMTELAARGIHVHHYGSAYARWGSRWVRAAGQTPYLHLHPDIEPRDWVRGLSRYDAGWLHVNSSSNGGDLRTATWDDLNVPARLNTYAVAGLPWIFQRNPGSDVAVATMAGHYDVGVAYDNIDHLAELLRHERRTRARRTAMRRHRPQFLFDTHVPRLVELFRSLVRGGPHQNQA